MLAAIRSILRRSERSVRCRGGTTQDVASFASNLFLQHSGDVTNYEKTRALAVAREASCRQRDNCLWNQRFAMFGNLFGTLSEDQKLLQNVNCDAIFAGCLNYH